MDIQRFTESKTACLIWTFCNGDGQEADARCSKLFTSEKWVDWSNKPAVNYAACAFVVLVEGVSTKLHGVILSSFSFFFTYPSQANQPSLSPSAAVAASPTRCNSPS